MDQLIIQNIQAEYPGVRESTILKKYALYEQLVYEAYIIAIVKYKYFKSHQPGYYQINKEYISDALVSNSKRWLSIFEKHAPLYVVVKEGNKFIREYSHVKFRKEAYDTFLTAAARTNIMDIAQLSNYKKYASDAHAQHGNSNITWLNTPIDTNSLQAYIEFQTNILQSGRIKVGGQYRELSPALRNKVQEEMFYATLVKDTAHNYDDHLPQMAESSNSGRIYYKGINLQSCPKAVRQAALGDCHQYDINACAYAIMLNEVYKIAKPDFNREEIEKTFNQVYNYITDRSKLRTMVVNDMNAEIGNENADGDHDHYIKDVTTKQVKEAFTSIGFGSRSANACWVGSDNKYNKTSIRKTFGSKDATNLFLQHWYVTEFLSQVKAMRELIYDHYVSLDNNFEVIKGFGYKRKSGELKPPTKSEALAHIYQSLESQLLLNMVDIAGNDNVLLLIHDGFITQRKLLRHQRERIHDELANPYITLTSDIISAYVNTKPTNTYEDHRAFIAREERAALDYTPISTIVSTDDKTIVSTEEAYKALLRDMGATPKVRRTEVYTSQTKDKSTYFNNKPHAASTEDVLRHFRGNT